MPNTRASQARSSMDLEAVPSEDSNEKRALRSHSRRPGDVHAPNDNTISIEVKPFRAKNKKRRSSEFQTATTDTATDTPKRRKTRTQPRVVTIEEHPPGIVVDSKALAQPETSRSQYSAAHSITDESSSAKHSPWLVQQLGQFRLPSKESVDTDALLDDRAHQSISTVLQAQSISQHNGAPPTPVTPHAQRPTSSPESSPWLTRLFGSGNRASVTESMDLDVAPSRSLYSHSESASPQIEQSLAISDLSPWLKQQQQDLLTAPSNSYDGNPVRLPQTPISTRKRKDLRATSMPPDLTNNGIRSPASALRNLRLTPLKTVLNQRIKSRLEASDNARRSRGKHVSIAADEHEDMLVLDAPDKLMNITSAMHTQETNNVFMSATSNTQESSHLEGPECDKEILRAAQAEWELERRKFEQAVLSLTRNANDATAHLRILGIELQSLGFGDADVSTTVIIESIRQSFSQIRETLVAIFPEAVSEDMTTKDLITLLLSNTKSLNASMRRQNLEVSEKNTLIQDLGRQIQGLLDHLAEVEIRKTSLQQQWRGMDEANEKQSREIEDLEKRLSDIHAEHAELKAKIDTKIMDVQSLGEENTTLMQSLEKLTKSLEGYRAEENRLISLITRMENEHRDELQKVNRKYDQSMKEIETQLDRASSLYADTERQSEQRFSEISSLNQRITIITNEHDATKQKLAEVVSKNDEDAMMRVKLEDDLKGKNNIVHSLTERLEVLQREMNEVGVNMDNLRDNHASERRQREAAEADLDQRNNEISSLNTKIQTHGIQANELRQKLFQVQQQHEIKVKELELSMANREEWYRGEITQEAARREDAVHLSEQHNATIQVLEAQIKSIEVQMHDDLEARDTRIEELDSSLKSVRDQLQASETTFEKEMNEERKHGDDLEAIIVGLEETISRHETSIFDLEQEASAAENTHQRALEERGNKIKELEVSISEVRNVVANLEADREGLERRVEEEAEQMLQLQNHTADEISDLRSTIEEKDRKMRNVEEKAIEADQRWQEVLDARDTEITELQNSIEENTEQTTTITTEFNLLKATFSNYISRTNEVVANMQAALADLTKAKAEVDEEASTLKLAGETMLSKLESINSTTQQQISKTTHMTKQSSSSTSQRNIHSSGKSRTRSGRHSQRDSGVGLIEER